MERANGGKADSEAGTVEERPFRAALASANECPLGPVVAFNLSNGSVFVVPQTPRSWKPQQQRSCARTQPTA